MMTKKEREFLLLTAEIAYAAGFVLESPTRALSADEIDRLRRNRERMATLFSEIASGGGKVCAQEPD